MHHLFNPAGAAGILLRLENLQPDARRQWGKMNASQMLAHCSASLETAMGLTYSRPVGPVARLFGRMLKRRFFGGKPFPKNAGTDPAYVITDSPDFTAGKARLMQQIRLFCEGGPAKCTRHPQAFFGPLTPEEWAVMQWKHLDHHLRQFAA